MAAETATLPTVADAKRKDAEPPRDLTREIFETLVFVVVLVLLLKLFVAEAFVIPTGSMAPSLWGDQVRCTCRECGHKFPINATMNLGDNNRKTELSTYDCENCGYHCDARNVQDDFAKVFPWSNDRIFSGDRVLVAKYAYHLRDPRRFDVPVFKYPVEPYAPKEMQGMNYIKRLVGLGGETLAVFAGDLYVTRDLHYEHMLDGPAPTEDEKWRHPFRYRPPNENDAWQFPYMYPNDQSALKAFSDGKFTIVRKTPDQILAMRRIVFDLDKQPKSVSGIRKTRWHPAPQEGAGWEMEATGFRHAGDGAGWMRYQHINPWREDEKAYFIADHVGYNNQALYYNQSFPDDGANEQLAKTNHWVSDLILECTVEIPSGDAEVVLELNKGPIRVQATFARGECKLARYHSDGDKETRTDMGSQSTKITKGGTYALRFANVDRRLTVWVDNKPLGFSAEQCEYELRELMKVKPAPEPVEQFMPEEKDKLQPARIGAKGDVKVTKVSLWRDLHYNCSWRPDARPDAPLDPRSISMPKDNGNVQTYYVQPGHYLMFGDNVNSSKDSRSWGQVPHRLMLGRAVVVYWPLSRLGVIE